MASYALSEGIPTLVEFFSSSLAMKLKNEGLVPKVITGCNVLAHVPDLNDFILGISILLEPEGVGIFEFPHVAQMLINNQFDTIYHEHYSYLSLKSLTPIFNRYGLEIYDVQAIDIHGGSLRIFVKRFESVLPISSSVRSIQELELLWSPVKEDVRESMNLKTHSIISEFTSKLIEYRERGLKVVAFGAAAKGTTLLNAAKVDQTLIQFAVDSSTAKIGKFIPGTGIQILHPGMLQEIKPDVVVVLAWNFADEIMTQARSIFVPNQCFLIPIPNLTEIYTH